MVLSRSSVFMGCRYVHEWTSQYGGGGANVATTCPCGADVDSLSHLMFDCPAMAEVATSAQRSSMFDGIRSLPGCEELCSVLHMYTSSIKVMRFVSGQVWGGSGADQLVSKHVAGYISCAGFKFVFLTHDMSR